MSINPLDLVQAEFTNWLSQRYAVTTWKKYIIDVQDFIETVGHPAYVNKQNLFAWYDSVCKDVAPATSNRKLAAIRTFFRFLKLHDMRLDDPTDLLEVRKRDKRLPNPIPHDQLRALLQHVQSRRTESCWHAQDCAILELLYGSGIRRDECARLTTADIISPEVLRVFGKGSKERLTILTDAAYQAVIYWWAVYHGDKLDTYDFSAWFRKQQQKPEPLFYSPRSQKPFVEYVEPGHQVWLRVRACGLELGLDMRPHRFRHSFGTELVDKEVPLQDVADVMGHNSIETTRGYVDRGERGLKLIRQKHVRTLDNPSVKEER